MRRSRSSRRRATAAKRFGRRAAHTRRCSEVFQLIAEGKANKDMALVLAISLSTVETHRARILEKLDLHSAAEIVLCAMRRGVVR